MTTEPSPATLTFLFADLESSTRLWEQFPTAMNAALERHDSILSNAVELSNGRVVKTTGDGLMAVFPSAAAGVTACLEAQLRLLGEPWGQTGPLLVRMGLHAGEAQHRGDDFFGPPVYRSARIMAAANGGQVLLSALVAELAGDRLPSDVGLRDLGEHRLKDLLRPEHLFQLVHPELPGDFPPLATLSHRPNNLPTQVSEFLGREAELVALRDLLKAAGARLLTLIGPGGIGKTRLALQATADQMEHFEDGLYFVDLSAVRDQQEAFEAMIRAVGLVRTSDEPPLEVLAHQLRNRNMLLLVDNFEQVMGAAGGVADLLVRCPYLKILVTSREALRVRGEHLLPVPPLSLPQDGDALTSAEAVAGYEAVRLFVERAREVRPSFALTDGNAAAVAEICARLDGLPLAIELAAARLKLFSPHDLRDRLRSRLELLRGGPRDLPARQQTLRSTIEWSHELLDAEERAVFCLLSLFSTARVEAVEEIALRLEPLRDVDVVERLASLVDKSLVRSQEGPGPQRLSMLETIREYAAERLDEEPELRYAARQAHAEYFSDFARTRRDRLYGSGREDTLDELAAEIGNLLTAWRYWVGAGDLEKLEELLDALWVLHDARGWYHAAVELARDLLGTLSAVPSTPDRVQKKITLASSLARGLLAISGYTEEVEEAYRRALALLEEAGGLPHLFPVLRSLASFHLYRAEFDQAAAVGRQLLDLAEQQDDVDLQVEGHLVLGANLSSLGDVATGLEHLDRAIALFDPLRHVSGHFRLGPSPGVVAHTTSAFYLWLLGYPDRAVGRAARGLELARQLNHPFTLAYAFFHVGFLDLWRRELELVHERANGALEIAEQHDYQVWRGLALVLQGVAMTGLGRAEEGLARSDHGIALYRGLKTPPVFWPPLLSVRAIGFALGGRPADGLAAIDQAIELFGGRVNFLYPEAPLLKGDLLLTVSGAAAAEPWFRSAFDAAGEVGARMSQLRAATRLTRLWRAANNALDGTEMLLNVYQSFTEGFDTPDLVEARALLDGIDTPPGVAP
ncbi:MAG: adenylate/guanylate cyclase domain-containing protein [Actinomycetota bacterium]|nr:adenylate/guanylate cyclase domain-containing protein [Actinomycetota bacterium]